jgi:hypothetical protein
VLIPATLVLIPAALVLIPAALVLILLILLETAIVFDLMFALTKISLNAAA